MKLLNEYFAKEKEIFAYFGYEENWTVFPLNDNTEFFWRIEGGEVVQYAGTLDELQNEEGNYYENEITNQHLPKQVYRGAEYTMICVDTNCDGNKFLSVFSNDKEMTTP